MDKQYGTKELQRLEEGPKAKMHIDSLRATLKNRKTPAHDGYWFKKFTSIHNRLVIEMNRHLEETDISEWWPKERLP